MEKNYDIRQAANLLGIKTRTAREWIRQGKIKGFKYGLSNRWFIAESEVQRIREDVTKNVD